MFRDVPTSEAALLKEVMHQLDDAPPSPKASRRRSIRRDIRTTMHALLLAQESKPRVRIFTRNISTSGIGFVTRRPFTAGELLVIGIERPQAERKLVVAKVTFVRYLRKGMYEIGAEFQQAVVESQASVAMRRLMADHL